MAQQRVSNHKVIAVIGLLQGMRVSRTELNSMVETLFRRELLRRANQGSAYVDAHHLECRALSFRKSSRHDPSSATKIKNARPPDKSHLVKISLAHSHKSGIATAIL